jgi:hypothetical protein
MSFLFKVIAEEAADIRPDSALLHYPYGNRSTPTLEELIQDADGTANNLTNVSGAYYDDYAEEGNGTDAYGDLTDWSAVNFGANMDSGFAVFLTVETTDTGTTIGSGSTSGNLTTFWGQVLSGDTDQDFTFRIDDENGNTEQIKANEIDIGDGKKHRICLDAATEVGTTPSASDMNIWMDGVKLETTTDFSQGFSSSQDFSNTVVSHARNRDGVESFIDATIDNIIAADETTTAQAIRDDAANQPWWNWAFDGSIHTGSDIPSDPYGTTNRDLTEPRPEPEADNPVLTAADVSDVSDVLFVADPFILVEDGDLDMFFEVRKGPNSGDYAVTGHATSNDDGITWDYNQIVIDPGYHVSFPHVFKWNDSYYIIHGQNEGNVPLWKADSYPTSWSNIGNLVDSSGVAADNFDDPTIFRFDGRWWLFTSSNNSTLNAYYSDTLESFGWNEHANNPVKSTGTANDARPGSRAIAFDTEIYIGFQRTSNVYGEYLDYFRIDDLTTTSYSDTEVNSEMLGPTGSGWNSERMHHYDPWYLGDSEGGAWRAAVDGYDGSEWTIGIYTGY